MKAEIHPKYEEVSINCACGTSYRTRSTRGDYKIEICAACHPFYTGKEKLIDSAGRIERFNRKYGRATQNS